MWRGFYTVLLWVFIPYAVWRIGRRHGWRPMAWGEYWGRVPAFTRRADSNTVVWVHMVSVGEVNAAEGLLRHLQQKDSLQLCLTCTTLAAKKRLQSLFPNCWHSFLPLDYPFAVGRFLGTIKPDMGIILEAEFWPHLLAQAKKRGVKLMLANARLSARSARRFSYCAALFRQCMAAFDVILAQTARDAGRLRCYRRRAVASVGNLKFDAPALLADLSAEAPRLSTRPIVLLASTRAGEETLLLNGMGADFFSRYFLIIALRHPERAVVVADLLKNRSLSYAQRSAGQAVAADTQVYIADTIGEMGRWYQQSAVVIVGGSFIDYGGQNPIEPMLAGCPTVIGPHVRHYSRLVQRARRQGALFQAAGASEAVALVDKLMQPDERLKNQQALSGFCEQHKGALPAHIAAVEKLLTENKEQKPC